MNSTIRNLARLLAGAAVLAGLTFAQAAWAVIDGITGTVFNFTARADHISTADGNSLYAWGYANDDGTGRMQYPGPTLIVNEGDTVTINLRNALPVPVSIVFPGHPGVLAAGGLPGMMTQEAPPDAGATVVSYTFTATQPGTYMYHSGTHPSLQVEMGLVGAIVVRPAQNALTWAYNHQLTRYDHEYLFLLTEMDDKIHSKVEAQVLASQPVSVDMTKVNPVLWFINGRNAPDTMAEVNHPLLPTQPYNCLPRMHPGETLLMRVVNAGRDMHPFHTHGNNFTAIARDGRMLSSGTNGPDLGFSDFTLKTIPGETYDALFTWTGANLGWNFNGTDVASLPVTLPNLQNVTIGTHWGGSPFLGQTGSLPPGGTTINPTGGYYFMWHSHNEKEITNNDIFPGGMMTMLIVEAAGVPIP